MARELCSRLYDDPTSVQAEPLPGRDRAAGRKVGRHAGHRPPFRGVHSEFGMHWAELEFRGAKTVGPRRKDIKEAAADYDEFAREILGKRARFNFPLPGDVTMPGPKALPPDDEDRKDLTRAPESSTDQEGTDDEECEPEDDDIEADDEDEDEVEVEVDEEDEDENP